MQGCNQINFQMGYNICSQCQTRWNSHINTEQWYTSQPHTGHELVVTCLTVTREITVSCLSWQPLRHTAFSMAANRCMVKWASGSVIALSINNKWPNMTKGRITAAHGWFNCIQQVAPICTPIGICTYCFCTSLSRFEYIDRGHVRTSAVCHLGF